MTEEIQEYKGIDEAMPSSDLLQQINNLSTNFYHKASELIITPKEQKKLQAPVDNDLIEIRPDGLIYYPQVFARQQLNDAFGIGQWALIQHSITKIGNILCFDGSLYVRGCFMARAMGEHEYIESNRNTSWASVYESAKSDCLVRCCKDLGIGKELWQPKFAREWVQANAVKVFIKVKNRNTQQEETKVSWRRKDQAPYWNESGIVPTDKNTQQKTEQKKPEPPKTDIPVQRNFTKEASERKSLDELSKWWKSLNKEEQRLASAVKENRKKELTTNEKAA